MIVVSPEINNAGQKLLLSHPGLSQYADSMTFENGDANVKVRHQREDENIYLRKYKSPNTRINYDIMTTPHDNNEGNLPMTNLPSPEQDNLPVSDVGSFAMLCFE